MIKKILIKTGCAIFLFYLLHSTASADSAKDILENLRKLKEHAESTSRLDDILETTKKLQDRHQEEALGIDPETKGTLTKLKNPFAPQLPQKATPPIPVPPEDIRRQPRPEDLTPAPPTPTPEPTPALPETNPDFKMSGIVWNTDRPQAIIEGRIVVVGDTLQDWEITAISKDGVEIQKGDRKFTLQPVKNIEREPQSSPDSRYNAKRPQRNTSAPPSPSRPGDERIVTPQQGLRN